MDAVPGRIDPASSPPTPARNGATIDLLFLFFMALIVRLSYMAAASYCMGFEAFSTFAPDSKLYQIVAEHMLVGHLRGPSVLLIIGPGYGAVLAAIQWMFGPHEVFPILFNILLGSLSPLLVYLIATRLVENRWVALAAGLISALSLTGTTTSCHIMTDQPLFFFYAAALLSFILGYQRRSRGWFITAGLTAAAALMVRGSGQLAIPVFGVLALVLPVKPLYASRRELILRAGLAVLIAGSAVFAWSLRNLVKEDQFVFMTLPAITMRHCLVAQALANDDAELIQKYRVEMGLEEGEGDLERYRGAYDIARQKVAEAWRTMPGRMLYYFFYNVDINLRAPNDYVGLQIPPLALFMADLNLFVVNYWGYVLLGLSLLGILLLALTGRPLAAWILGTHYIAFTLFCGSSFWQGSRLHYTAELAWAILVPSTFLILFELVRRGVRKFRGTVEHGATTSY